MKNKSYYQKCLKQMFSLRRFGIKLGLSTIQNILNNLGNPQNNFKAIHIAGTNGKGSIAATIASILIEAGFKVGLYTSPHLVKFNERITVNNRQISDNEVVESFQTISMANQGAREATFFEITTAMAFYNFAKHKVDWAVIETGMGGRLDATNVLNPIISIISNISLEHQAYLGDTTAQIAAEKGGIIKNQTPVISGVQETDAIKTLSQISQEKNAPLYFLGKDFHVAPLSNNNFDYIGINNNLSKISTPLQGNHQINNTAIAIAAWEMLAKKAFIHKSNSVLKLGIEKTKWPGRLEIIAKKPYVIMDGAHNPAAFEALLNFLSKNITGKRITLIIGILDDKCYQKMLSSILPICNNLVITKPITGRALDSKTIYQFAVNKVKQIEIIESSTSAVNKTLQKATPNDAICIAGSLYLIGEIKEAIQNNKIIFNN